MTVLDLIGLLAFLGTGLTLIVAGFAMLICVARRRWRGLRRLVGGSMILLATYAVALLLAGIFSQERLLSYGQPRCFDDWCVAVMAWQRVVTLGDASIADSFVVTVRVSSQAKRVTQRPSEPRFWLLDAQGRRYDLAPAGLAAWERAYGPARPVDDQLGPGEHFDTPLVFTLPTTIERPTLVIAEGPSWLGLIMIGSEDSPFHGRTLVRLWEP